MSTVCPPSISLFFGGFRSWMALAPIASAVPVNAHTTASDALWAGIPVVTLSGETFISRVAGSLLNATGLPELITNTLDNYIQCARELARDPARIQAYKDRLVTQRASLALFDTERYTRALERRYQQIWTNTCAGHHTALID